MTPEQWLNVAECARRRWEALVFRDRAGLRLSPAYWQQRCGEWESWQSALELSGRCPF